MPTSERSVPKKPLHELVLPLPQSELTEPQEAQSIELLELPKYKPSIELPKRVQPWRVWIIDDKEPVLDALATAANIDYAHAIALRCFPSATMVGHPVEVLTQAMHDHGAPDLLVIDTNLAVGGVSSFSIIEQLRRQPGGSGFAIVLATGAPLHEVAEGRITEPAQFSGEPISDWNERALAIGAEAMIFEKTGDPVFLGRLGESITNWQASARRRAWSKLLRELAGTLDDKAPDKRRVGDFIARFLNTELRMQSVIIRWRKSGDLFALIGNAGLASASTRIGDLRIDELPVLGIVTSSQLPDNLEYKPVHRRLSREDTGLHGEGLIGRNYLGCGAFVGNRAFGFISMLRDAELPDFDEIDRHGIQALAAMLGAALGRFDAVALLDLRQHRLLQFANEVTQATTRTPVCDAMARLLHEVLHDNNDGGRVSCLLIDFSSGELSPKGVRLGFCTSKPPKALSIWSENSVCARAVRTKVPRAGLALEDCLIRIADVREETTGYFDVTGGMTRSELCVPIIVGRNAIGVVNLEHQQIDRYTREDARFVQGVAAAAAQAILNASAHRVERALMAFSDGFTQLTVAQLETRLGDVLYRLCGYSVMLVLEPSTPDDPNLPWRVKSVDAQLKFADPVQIQASVNTIYETQWAGDSNSGSNSIPWLAKLLQAEAWKQEWAYYSDSADDFVPVNLGSLPAGLGSPTPMVVHQQADAILWLRADGDLPPHGALLLMWGLPPPMGSAQVELLRQVAQQMSSLRRLARHVDDQVRARLIGEQQGKIGAVMQHFRHRLAGLTRAHRSSLSDMQRHLDNGNLALARLTIPLLQAYAKNVDEAMHVSRGYVKSIDKKAVPVSTFVDAALGDESWLARSKNEPVALTRTGDFGITVMTDPVIAALVLYSLLENAHDAVRELPEPDRHIGISVSTGKGRVLVDVFDSGPGVEKDMQDNLFQYGHTSKGGLGSALAFAHARCTDMGARLDFVGNRPKGACFRLILPRAANEDIGGLA